jgi:MipA family protein
METYFSITPENVGKSGLRYYDAEGGMKDVYIQPMVMVRFYESWLMAAGVRVKSLLSDASDSPVVDDRGDSTQVTAGLAVAYSW